MSRKLYKTKTVPTLQADRVKYGHNLAISYIKRDIAHSLHIADMRGVPKHEMHKNIDREYESYRKSRHPNFNEWRIVGEKK